MTTAEKDKEPERSKEPKGKDITYDEKAAEKRRLAEDKVREKDEAERREQAGLN